MSDRPVVVGSTVVEQMEYAPGSEIVEVINDQWAWTIHVTVPTDVWLQQDPSVNPGRPGFANWAVYVGDGVPESYEIESCLYASGTVKWDGYQLAGNIDPDALSGVTMAALFRVVLRAYELAASVCVADSWKR